SMVTRSERPAASKRSRSTNSAMGERQMLPVHTTVIRYATMTSSSRTSAGRATRGSGVAPRTGSAHADGPPQLGPGPPATAGARGLRLADELDDPGAHRGAGAVLHGERG